MLNTKEMFNVTIEKNVLLPALTQATKTLPKASNIQALQGVLIERVSGGIQLTTYNLQTGASRFIPLENESFDLEEVSGRILVDAKTLLEIVKKSNKDILLEQISETKMAIISGKNRFELSLMDATEFPKLPEGNEMSLTLSGDILQAMSTKIAKACAKEEIRPILTGVFLQAFDGNLKMIATDSHRLHSKTVTLGTPAELKQVIPQEAIGILGSMVKDTDNVNVGVAGNHFFAKTDTFKFVSRLLDGTFPDTNRIIPTQFKFVVSANRLELIDIFESSLVFAKKDTNHVVRVNFVDSSMHVFYKDETNKFQSDVTVQTVTGNANDFKIGFNVDYTLEALKAMDGEEVFLHFTGDASPFIFKTTPDAEEFYLILPVRTY